MKARYSPWWMPLSIVLLLACCLILFVLLVKQTAEQKPAINQVEQGEQKAQYEWKLVTSWPKNFPGLGLAPETFARYVNEMSGGRLKIHVYGAREIVGPLEVFDAVSAGSVEMGHSGAYYWKGKIPASVFFTSVPFGMNAQSYNAWLHYGDGLKLWREAYAPFNLVPFAGGNTGVQMGGWFNREINTVEDLRGLKMRIPGLGGEVFSRAGGIAQNIPGGELYTSLQTGVIDATEWVGPYNDLAFGFHQIAEYYYYPGWHEPGPGLEFIANKQKLEALPKDLQKIIEVAARATNQDMLDEYTANNNRSLQELIKKHNVDVRPFPKDVLLTLKKYADEIYAEQAAKDPLFAKVYESYKAFLLDSRDYMKISEEAYYQLPE